jgi:hypothetical protein
MRYGQWERTDVLRPGSGGEKARSLPGATLNRQGGRCYTSFVTGCAPVRPGDTIHGTAGC